MQRTGFILVNNKKYFAFPMYSTGLSWRIGLCKVRGMRGNRGLSNGPVSSCVEHLTEELHRRPYIVTFHNVSIYVKCSHTLDKIFLTKFCTDISKCDRIFHLAFVKSNSMPQ